MSEDKAQNESIVIGYWLLGPEVSQPLAAPRRVSLSLFIK